MVALDLPVVALDLLGSVDQEPPHGVVGALLWDMVAPDLPVVVLDLPRLLETRI